MTGEFKDFSKEIQNLWAMNQELSNASCLAFTTSKSEVMSESLSTLSPMTKRLTKNKEMTLHKRATAEIFFPEYDSDPRELYVILEVHSWFLKTIVQGIPGFFFLDQSKGMGLKISS